MSRITLSVDQRDHNALRLLALQRNKKVMSLIQDAIRQYLTREGGYNLVIRSTQLMTSPSDFIRLQ